MYMDSATPDNKVATIGDVNAGPGGGGGSDLMDLISGEHFKILTEPFAEVLTELGIVWKETEFPLAMPVETTNELC